MTAYVIADVEVANPEHYAQYTALSPAAIEAAGGEFIVRGGNPATLEGDWSPSRIVVARFKDIASAKAFYDSALYREARAKRKGATSRFNMIVVEGYEG